ncbi:isochorismate synthase MenF [Gordonia sp. OPL2]|uniref:isochorismate synthase n=1 Tax=Gordonia sp. OPL2 TaxID=2486274 RepID=UPI0021CC8A96|nr:isochorismate synthase [Gordonia sp. OPL2]
MLVPHPPPPHPQTPSFVLSRPDRHVVTTGVNASFDDVAAAQRALSARRHRWLVGALPFDLRDPAALIAPETLNCETGPWRPPTIGGHDRVVTIDRADPQPADHRRRVADIVAELRGNPAMEKVVLARKLLLRCDSAISAHDLAARLCAADPGGNAFLTDLSPAGADRDGHHLVGASPEVLVRKEGRVVTCHPLAGSAARDVDPVQDAHRRDLLAISGKDRHEHRLVVDAIRAVLTPLCTDLRVPAEPTMVATPAMWHLGTPIRGVVDDPDLTALDLALALHPTPAVCGTPTGAARDLIREVEGDRGFYAGAVGWTDASGDGEWMVAIRCAEIDGDGRGVTTWAGGGIVAASDPDDELRETESKFRTILDALDVADDTASSPVG